MNKNGNLITESFEKLATRISKLEKRPGTLCPIYLEGGASLFMHNIKNEFKDIDWFVPVRWLKYNEISKVKNPGEDLHCETLIEGFTFNPTHETKIISKTEYNGITFELHCLNPAMVFLMKLDTGRDKDIRDMETICSNVKPDDIVKAINACIGINNREIILNVASQALSEVTCHSLLDMKPTEYKVEIARLINSLMLNSNDKETIGMSFGIDINTTYKPENDTWKTASKRNRSMSSGMNP